MTNTSILADFISKGNKYCDDCLSDALNIKPRQQINQISRKLEKESGYRREKQQCVNCSKDKLVTLKWER